MKSRNSKLTNVSVGMGGAIIITIFVVLCLTVFSVLSFTTAFSDYKLAKKTEEMTYDYYLAHGKAEVMLYEIYDLINSKGEIENIDSAARMLSGMEGISIIEKNGSFFKIYYEALGNKNQKICVTLIITFYDNDTLPQYKIESWNLAMIDPPVYTEENYNLWEGFE